MGGEELAPVGGGCFVPGQDVFGGEDGLAHGLLLFDRASVADVAAELHAFEGDFCELGVGFVEGGFADRWLRR